MMLAPDMQVCIVSESQMTMIVEDALARLRSGDDAARERLVNQAYEQLRRIVKKQMGQFDRLRRWEQTDDVLQTAALKLFKSLEHVQPHNARAFYGLAATQIRRVLIDLSRHHFGPHGRAAHHATAFKHGEEEQAKPIAERAPQAVPGPATQVEHNELHALVEQLPQTQREVFDLLFYWEMSQDDAAETLGVSTRTIKRRWRDAKLSLHKLMGGGEGVD